jgi:hypothetical protein
MKTLFKLVIAILLLNAAVRGGLAMWQYYQFKDAAQQVVLFGQRADPEDIQANIVARATELNVPVRLDVDQNTPVALEYDAQAVPKFAVLDGDGKVVKSMEGYLDPEAFLAWLKG